MLQLPRVVTIFLEALEFPGKKEFSKKKKKSVQIARGARGARETTAAICLA